MLLLHQKLIVKNNPALWSIKIRISYTLFDVQNAGNRISELQDFKFFWEGGEGGGMPPDPQGERGFTAPLLVTATY